MSNPVSCSYCKSKIDLSSDPPECHICSLGHPLCEYCNHMARGYCFRCGGRMARRLPDKDVKELYRASPNNFMQKILESRTLVLPNQKSDNDMQSSLGTSESTPQTTVVGFRKWPRTFFSKVPTTLDKLTSNEKNFLEKLPNIIEDDDQQNQEVESKTGWECLPKSFTDFELAAEVLECPLTSCKYPICNTDAMRHLLQSHDDIPILSLPRNIIGEFSLDAKTVRKNEIKCVTRILVPGVIKDLGITKHKDCLPLYLLYTRVNSSEAEEELDKLNTVRNGIYSDEAAETNQTQTEQQGQQQQQQNVIDETTLDDNAYAMKNPWRKHDCLVIWCAGVVPLDHPITIAITVSPRNDKAMNFGGLVRVFSLHIPQSSHGIYSNTERLIISRHDLKRLTKTDHVIDGQVCIL